MVASYEASQRLFNSGITVKTEKTWDVSTTPPTICYGEGKRYIPAPNLIELWNLIPKGTSIHVGEGECYIQYKPHDHCECNIITSNPSDGICDLLVWLKKKENEPTEKADKLIKRLIDSYCDVESDPESNLETKVYLNAREEVKNLLIKALEVKK
jgi:hypothetical protein